MKNLLLFKRLIIIGLIMLFGSGWVMGQITIDFEIENNLYSASATEGSGDTDVFNRSNPDIGDNSTYIWACEDLSIANPSISLDQIDISSKTSFTFSVDFLTPTSEQWDSTDELLITYSIDGGEYQNLLWVQSSVTGDATNTPAALDLDFDREGDDGQELPAISDAYGAGVGSNFETFTTSSISLSGNSTLDIKLQFNGLTATGEGIYLDDIVISLSSGTPPPTITVSTPSLTGFSYIEGSGPSAEKTFTVEGANLTANITLTAPTNYEISATSGSGFTSPITLIQSGGTVTSTTIYTRLKAGLSAGTYNSEVITASSTAAANKTVSCNGTVITSASIIINEVDADTEGTDVLEFIELYDGGAGNTPLNGLVLVLYNGSDDMSYLPVFDLDGYSTDVNGYFVIGNTLVSNVDLVGANGFLQNGQDAVALFYGNDSDFPNDTPLTTTNLIDALVYHNSTAIDAALLVLLNPDQLQINEASRENSPLHSNQRLPNGTGGARNTSTYGQYFPTPGAVNDDWLTTWDGSTGIVWTDADNWSDGVPSTNHDVTIPTGLSNYPTISATTSANCYDLTLAGTATLTIVSTGTEANGSLIFAGTYTGSSTAVTYKRYMLSEQGHLFGTPLKDQTINADFLTDNSINGMKHYNESDDTWSTNYFPSGAPGTSFVLGKGYIAKLSSAGTVSLIGTPNNALTEVTLTKGAGGYGWNLLSNPFTSAIAANIEGGADNLITANTAVLHDSYEALYIWNGSAYVIINHSGGTPGVSLVQNYLQVGQGFFVKSVNPAIATKFRMTTAMQSHQTAIAFKSSESTWASIILNAELSNAKASTRILYRDDMTSGLDIGYDAGLFNSNPDFSLYSRLVEDNGVDFGLQCLPTNYEDLIVPIGLDAKAGEIVKFSANALNIPEEYAVVLEDRATNTFKSLSEVGEEYNIQLSSDSDGTGRFFVHTSFKSALGLDDLGAQNAFQVFSRVKDNQLVIRGDANTNTVLRIYSITGKQVAVVNLKQSSENLVQFNEDAGVYIVQISNEQETFTQKFVWVK